jgi:hypothetical protein
MGFLESWWQRSPRFVRLALSVVPIVALVLGGSADHYWT